MDKPHNIQIAGRFQRSIEISRDFGNPEALDGYICPPSSREALHRMAEHIAHDQCAFTWTGPYGCGKSSLALAYLSTFSNNSTLSAQASDIIGNTEFSDTRAERTNELARIIVVPVVGTRSSVAERILEALPKRRISKSDSSRSASDVLIDTLSNLTKPSSQKRLVIVFDEMGKTLEHAASGESDVYVFQRIAELANRSNGRLIFIGILHQSFAGYANRLAMHVRDEWAKVQGRFVDLNLSVAAEESILLISNAIVSDDTKKGKEFNKYAVIVATQIANNRPTATEELAGLLSASWPLHPLVTSLLGAISKRRFSQNQRSVFSFLSSHEAHGFQEFIKEQTNDYFGVARLWDYYRSNLEQAILISTDSHRWTQASTKIDQCQARGFEEGELQILKAIAVIDLFGREAGLVASKEVLKTITKVDNINRSLELLKSKYFIVYKESTESFGIFSGSDFNLDNEVRFESKQISIVNYSKIESLRQLQPIVAKRHYHDIGTLRWFSIELCRVSELAKYRDLNDNNPSQVGLLVVVLPDTASENVIDKPLVEQICRNAGEDSPSNILFGYSEHSIDLVSMAIELLATERVKENNPSLAGDEIARKETHERITALYSELSSTLDKILNNAIWYSQQSQPQILNRVQLNALASKMASGKFYSSPIVHNELLNRTKPSPSANSARNNLLRRMVSNSGEFRLGIDGYPAEGGLFESLLEKTELYKEVDGNWTFATPTKDDQHQLHPLWEIADNYLKDNEDKPVVLSDFYKLWNKAPYGVKNGLLPFLSVCYILTRQESLAIYRNGIYQSSLTDVFVEELVRNPELIALRWMVLSKSTRALMEELPKLLEDILPGREFNLAEPLSAARALVALYDGLPEYTKRTNSLSRDTIHFRNTLKKAKDPNSLLFNELPKLADVNLYDDENSESKVLDLIHSAMIELTGYYEIVLRRFRELLFDELKVSSLASLRKRATNVTDLTGDMSFNGFAKRLARYKDKPEDLKGIISLAAQKPANLWIDSDLDAAKVRIAELATQFLRAEGFARVKNRKDTRHAISFIVGYNGSQTPVSGEFSLSDEEVKQAKKLAKSLRTKLLDNGNPDVNLAAISEIGLELLKKSGAATK